MTKKRDYPSAPLIGIGAVIFKNTSILLIKRASPPHQGRWSLPGGLQEVGETIFDAAQREVLEETSITAIIKGLAGTVDSIHHDDKGNAEYHYTIIDVWGLWEAGEPIAGDDALEAVFVPLDQLAELDMWDEAYRIIDEALAQRNAQSPNAISVPGTPD